MIYKLTEKQCTVGENEEKIISDFIRKLEKLFSHVQPDLLRFSLVLKYNQDRYRLKNTSKNIKSYSGEKKMLAQYDLVANFEIASHALRSTTKGKTIEECLYSSFNKLSLEIEKYKGKHFSSQSDYPNQVTIRKR